jgi:hypothetical protein
MIQQTRTYAEHAITDLEKQVQDVWRLT